MRRWVLKGCGIVAAGLSSCALAANPIYTNKEYCFSADQPAGMSISAVRQGAQFNFGKQCGVVGELGCNSIMVYAMYFFQDTDLMADAMDMYPSEHGWVVKPDDGFGPVKGWSQQTLFKCSGDQQREVHIYARPLRKSELAARNGLVIAVGYRIIAEFDSSERKTFSQSVPQVLASWQMLKGCDPFAASAAKP